MPSQIFIDAKQARAEVARLQDSRRNELLNAVADAIVAESDALLRANAADLARMPEDDPRYDRLLLTPGRLEGIASDMRAVAGLPSPLGRVLAETVRPNGLKIKKISVPFGVIGMIYEARPNVTFDVFSLCLKSGNVCLLKGSKDADDSNRADRLS